MFWLQVDRKIRTGWILGVLCIKGCGIGVDELGKLGADQIAIGDPACKPPPLIEISRPDVDDAVEASNRRPFAVRAEGKPGDKCEALPINII